MDSENTDVDLDTRWIDEFEKLDSAYQSFYTEKIKNIRFNYVYISKENNIEKIKEETILLENENIISREEVINILKQNLIQDNKKYTVLSILKYNIDIEPIDVSFYLKNERNDDTFLHTVKNIDTISLNDTINMFQDLNNIIILFYEKKFSLNKTKRITIKSGRGTRSL
jgi:hypothetical protein